LIDLILPPKPVTVTVITFIKKLSSIVITYCGETNTSASLLLIALYAAADLVLPTLPNPPYPSAKLLSPSNCIILNKYLDVDVPVNLLLKSTSILASSSLLVFTEIC
jgi:hypothetical protein